MNRNTTIAIVLVVVVIIVVAAVCVYLSKGDQSSDKKDVTGEWELVAIYEGGWMDGVPTYGQDTTQTKSVKISHYEGDFYIFENGKDKLYCSWDGHKMVTSGINGKSNVAFIMQVPKNDEYLMVSYFEGDKAFIELYVHKGYVGKFPGFSIPLDLPKVGRSLDSFKVKEYAPTGTVIHDKSIMTMKAVNGRMVFYTEKIEEGDVYEYISIYLSSGIFMSMGVCGDSHIYDMTEYRGGVFYTSAMNHDTGNTWVAEFGNKSDADYPDVDITGWTYGGSENYIIYKDGMVVDELSNNGMILKVYKQDDEVAFIRTSSEDGSEIAQWVCEINDLRPLYHYGMFVQSYIDYKGVTYYGWYFGYFLEKDCKDLRIYGTLTSDDGLYVVISQTYTVKNS